MAVLPDYLNLSLLLRISNKQQTDIEYELPDDIRKWEDFQLPEGYAVVRGTLDAPAPGPPAVPDTVVLPVPADNVLVFVQASGNVACTVLAVAAAAMQGRMFLFASGTDRDTLITGITLTNQEAGAIEYTFLALPT